MAKFSCNVNTIRIHRNVYFTPGLCKEITTKEISELKYLMKLLQNQKLESELIDFQSILIVLPHPSFLNEEG